MNINDILKPKTPKELRAIYNVTNKILGVNEYNLWDIFNLSKILDLKLYSVISGGHYNIKIIHVKEVPLLICDRRKFVGAYSFLTDNFNEKMPTPIIKSFNNVNELIKLNTDIKKDNTYDSIFLINKNELLEFKEEVTVSKYRNIRVALNINLIDLNLKSLNISKIVYGKSILNHFLLPYIF